MVLEKYAMISSTEYGTNGLQDQAKGSDFVVGDAMMLGLVIQSVTTCNHFL